MINAIISCIVGFFEFVFTGKLNNSYDYAVTSRNTLDHIADREESLSSTNRPIIRNNLKVNFESKISRKIGMNPE